MPIKRGLGAELPTSTIHCFSFLSILYCSSWNPNGRQWCRFDLLWEPTVYGQILQTNIAGFFLFFFKHSLIILSHMKFGWCMLRFGEIQWDLVRISDIWWDLVQFSEIWWDFVRLSEIWWTMVKFVEIWYNWWDSVRSDEIWWDFLRFCEIWWDLVGIWLPSNQFGQYKNFK